MWGREMSMDEAAVSADGHTTAAHTALAHSTYGAAAVITNQPLVTAFISFAVAQAFKVLTSWYNFSPSFLFLVRVT